jgi:Pentapeptide repeats (8 copies)
LRSRTILPQVLLGRSNELIGDLIMNREELLERYAADERNFVGADFLGADLSNASLIEADFSGETQFTGANLSNAILDRANLEYAHFAWANLYNISMVRANLKYATISNTSLRFSNLTGSDLSHSELSYTDLRGSNLENVNLSGAYLDSADLMSIDLSTVNLTGVRRRGSNLILSVGPTNIIDKQIVRRLREEGQIKFPCDGDYSPAFLFWEIPRKNTITIQDILEWGEYGSRTTYEVHDFRDYFGHAIDETVVYEETLVSPQVYLISGEKDELFRGEEIYIIGKTPSGNFAGACYKPPGFWLP